MHIDRFTEADIEPFLALAEGEGWLCDRWEFSFLLQQFPQGCLVIREEEGTVGYITSIAYGKSGWIGNLIVHPVARRRGIGWRLMEAAMSGLLQSGVETIWLTASEQGAGLYGRIGFKEIDRINRWSGRVALKPGHHHIIDVKSFSALDKPGWGEPRDPLLKAVLTRGTVFSVPGGFLCCHKSDAGIQLGPWGCQSRVEALQLLNQALTDGYERVFLDVPAANLAAASLLVQRGLTLIGSTRLMYFGRCPEYRPGSIFSLATMGSSG